MNLILVNRVGALYLILLYIPFFKRGKQFTIFINYTYISKSFLNTILFISRPVKPAFFDESPQKGQSTTSLPIIKAGPSPCKKARWIYPNSKPAKGGSSSHEIIKRIRAHQRLSYMKGSESIQIAQKMTAIKRPKPI